MKRLIIAEQAANGILVPFSRLAEAFAHFGEARTWSVRGLEGSVFPGLGGVTHFDALAIDSCFEPIPWSGVRALLDAYFHVEECRLRGSSSDPDVAEMTIACVNARLWEITPAEPALIDAARAAFRSADVRGR